MAELGRDVPLAHGPRCRPCWEGFQGRWLSVWVSLKQVLRQEFKDKQILWERREILGKETGKAAEEGVLSSKSALWAAGA